MNKFSITKMSVEEIGHWPTKKCTICGIELSTATIKYWVDSDGWYAHRVCCSENCANLLVFQSMDDKPLAGFDHLSKSIQEEIDRQIIEKLKALAEKSK